MNQTDSTLTLVALFIGLAIFPTAAYATMALLRKASWWMPRSYVTRELAAGMAGILMGGILVALLLVGARQLSAALSLTHPWTASAGRLVIGAGLLIGLLAAKVYPRKGR